MSEPNEQEKAPAGSGGDPPHLKRDLLLVIWVVVLGAAAVWLVFRFSEQNRLMDCMARSNRGCIEIEKR